MKISIIIPTYNEEEYLPTLLESIKKQNFKDYEVIVADANSNDNTVKIAENYNCIIVKGGLPAIGRNNGAKVAKGELLLFLDSDLKLTENYLRDIVDEFEGKELSIGISQMTPLSEKSRDKFVHDLANWFMVAVENIKPHGAGCYGIISRKTLHDKCNGFNEELTFGEDTDYIERLAKEETFKVLRNPKICVSTRRLEEEGLYTLLKQYGKSTVNDFRGKRTSAEELGYGFGHDPIEALDKEYMEEIAKNSHRFRTLKEHEKLKFRKNNTASLTDKAKEVSSKFTKESKKTQSQISKTASSANKQLNNIATKTTKTASSANKQLNNIATKTSKTLTTQTSNLIKNKTEKSPIKKSERKKIFYAVCGEGMGHAIRSGVILETLTKKHDVYIFSSERAYEYLANKFNNVFEIGGFNTVYENNKVRNKKTLFNAIKTNPTNLKEGYDILYKQSKKVKPNIIISDFENYASMLSKIINVPLISLDNIHMITQTEYDYPPHHKTDMLTAKAVVKSYILRPKRHILTSFFFPKLRHPSKTAIYPPVIRDEIMKLKPEYGNHILVYQTSDSNLNLMESLKNIDEKFIVYGFNKNEKDKNLTYRSFNEDQIFEDMRTSKAIIANGGFTMITEAIYLKKPVYSIPAHKNFEQILNGYYVEKLGYGEMHEKLNTRQIGYFLKDLDYYQKNLKKVQNSDNSAILKDLEESIQKYAKDD